jgi:hypothetical protein
MTGDLEQESHGPAACRGSPAAAAREGDIQMVLSVAMTTIIGAVSYLWLTVVTRPLSQGLRATFHLWRGDGWRSALPITLGMALLAAAIPAAAFVLLTMSAPSVWTYLLDAAGLPLGLLAGGAVWCARAAAVGVPRVPPDVEMALALAVVALRSNDIAVISTAERQYGQHVLGMPVRTTYGAERMQTV